MRNFYNSYYPINNRSSNNLPQASPCDPPTKKKFDFKSFKKNTCTSLDDVECFLNKFSTFVKYIKLINLLK